MPQEFSKVMQEKSDGELLEIISKLKDDYQPEAVSAAEVEIKKRNLSLDQIERAEEEIKIKEKNQTEKEKEALGMGQKILFFLFFWGIIPWAMAGTFKAKGYKRKYKDAWRFMKIGMIVFLGIPVLIVIALSILG